MYPSKQVPAGRASRCFARGAFWLLILFLSGCATRFEIPPGRHVELVVTRSKPAESGVELKNKAIIGDATTGAASAGAVGALAGLSCGPWALLCSMAGYLSGAVIGGAAGAGVGLIESWSQEQVDRVRERLGRHTQKHDMVAELRAAIAERAGARWNLATGPMLVNVRVELTELSVHMQRAERGVLFARVRVESVLPEDPRYGPNLNRLLEFTGAPLSAQAWAELSDDDMERQFLQMQQFFALSIYLNLSGR